MKRIEAKAGERSSPLRDMIVFFAVMKHKKGTPRRRSFKGLIDFRSVEVATPYKILLGFFNLVGNAVLGVSFARR